MGMEGWRRLCALHPCSSGRLIARKFFEVKKVRDDSVC